MHGKATQVTDHGKNVCIYRVTVKQVVLHESDDVFECRQVGGQDAIGVHAPQFVRNTLRLPDYFHEQAAAGYYARTAAA